MCFCLFKKSHNHQTQPSCFFIRLHLCGGGFFRLIYIIVGIVWCLMEDFRFMFGFSEAQMSAEWVLCLHNIYIDCHE